MFLIVIFVPRRIKKKMVIVKMSIFLKIIEQMSGNLIRGLCICV